MDSLVNIAVFGVVGAVMMAALVGLLLVVRRRGTAPVASALLGAACVALLLAVPALAAAGLWGARPGAGIGQAFLVASAAVVVVYAAGVALLPLVARQAAAARGQAAPRLAGLGLRLSARVALGGLAVCAALGAAGTGIAAALS
ncbi:hypothetical protein ACFPZ0_14195 [Streptomonospora nanhaiensis]|uniref:hypothetical protein n=1 Tax=Streptomonospora nanhaiensis TaxID=1323731 RepID=UPI001C99E334|nr:hypothetical protein [Streptomonospora nanhaiensis]MBX9388194.1 hypothetical protein [Streptomonospora nanhaiensis]